MVFRPAFEIRRDFVLESQSGRGIGSRPGKERRVQVYTE